MEPRNVIKVTDFTNETAWFSESFTDSGEAVFGVETSGSLQVWLDTDQARELYQFLGEWLAKYSEPVETPNV